MTGILRDSRRFWAVSAFWKFRELSTCSRHLELPVDTFRTEFGEELPCFGPKILGFQLFAAQQIKFKRRPKLSFQPFKICQTQLIPFQTDWPNQKLNRMKPPAGIPKTRAIVIIWSAFSWNPLKYQFEVKDSLNRWEVVCQQLGSVWASLSCWALRGQFGRCPGAESHDDRRSKAMVATCQKFVHFFGKVAGRSDFRSCRAFANLGRRGPSGPSSGPVALPET